MSRNTRGPAPRRGNNGRGRGRGTDSMSIDKDGDVSMDPSSTGRGRGGRGRGPRGSSYNGGNSFSHSEPARLGEHTVHNSHRDDRQAHESRGRGNATMGRDGRGRQEEGSEQLSVYGWHKSKAAANPFDCKDQLLTFLERKASQRGPNVRILHARPSGDNYIITIKPQDAAAILRLNGFTFAGAPLTIKTVEEAPERKDEIPEKKALEKAADASPLEDAATLKTWLRSLLERRYDVSTKFLNLSALGTDPEVVASGILKSTTLERKFFPALMSVLDSIFTTEAEKREAFTSVSVSNNHLKSVTPVTSLAQTLPNLQNLDLSGNELASLKALDPWRRRFKSLQHLILTGNPIETASPSYHETLCKWYPNLQILNGVPIPGRSGQTPPISGSVQPQPGFSAAEEQAQNALDEENARKDNMVHEFSVYTKMNLEYARMCLEQTGFEPAAAEAAFNTAKANNQLPPAAFVHHSGFLSS